MSNDVLLVLAAKMFAHILTSSIVVERVFVIEGLGSLLLDSLDQENYIYVLLIMIFYSSITFSLFYISSYIQRKLAS